MTGIRKSLWTTVLWTTAVWLLTQVVLAVLATDALDARTTTLAVPTVDHAVAKVLAADPARMVEIETVADDASLARRFLSARLGTPANVDQSVRWSSVFECGGWTDCRDWLAVAVVAEATVTVVAEMAVVAAAEMAVRVASKRVVVALDRTRVAIYLEWAMVVRADVRAAVADATAAVVE